MCLNSGDLYEDSKLKLPLPNTNVEIYSTGTRVIEQNQSSVKVVLQCWESTEQVPDNYCAFITIKL